MPPTPRTRTRTMPFHLVSLAGGPSIRLDHPIVLFGRDDECDVVMASKKVSRKHCCLAQVDGYLVVRDLGSTNGILVNGRKVAEARLAPGDEVQIGGFKYQVCGDALGGSDDHSAVGGGQ
ncbi:MAG: FHA domain-containing protein [Gemmataceae bacterium]|nr:FHA domain-containing protein [Gemmataceae bacterium]